VLGFGGNLADSLRSDDLAQSVRATGNAVKGEIFPREVSPDRAELAIGPPIEMRISPGNGLEFLSLEVRSHFSQAISRRRTHRYGEKPSSSSPAN